MQILPINSNTLAFNGYPKKSVYQYIKDMNATDSQKNDIIRRLEAFMSQLHPQTTLERDGGSSLFGWQIKNPVTKGAYVFCDDEQVSEGKVGSFSEICDTLGFIKVRHRDPNNINTLNVFVSDLEQIDINKLNLLFLKAAVNDLLISAGRKFGWQILPACVNDIFKNAKNRQHISSIVNYAEEVKFIKPEERSNFINEIHDAIQDTKEAKV